METLKFVIGQLQKKINLDSRYRDHALGGDYTGHRECHIKSDMLLVYKIENNNLVLVLVDIGSHSDLFD